MSTPSPTDADPTARPGRLLKGELRRQVAVHLDEVPTDTFTAGEIARALGRSSGAGERARRARFAR